MIPLCVYTLFWVDVGVFLGRGQGASLWWFSKLGPICWYVGVKDGAVVKAVWFGVDFIWGLRQY